MSIIKRMINFRVYDVKKLLDLKFACKRLLYNNDNKWRRKTYSTLQNYSEEQNNSSIETDDNDTTKLKTVIYEKEEMHLLMQNSTHYSNSMFLPVKTRFQISEAVIKDIIESDWSKKSNIECLNGLKKIAYYHLNDSCLDINMHNILTEFENRVSTFEPQQIKQLGSYLIIMPPKVKQLHSYKQLSKEISKQCFVHFFNNIDCSEMLLIVDMFYQMNMYQVPYIWRALRKLGCKTSKMTGKQIVQFLFYVSVINTPALKMYDIECDLQERLPEITIDELGIALRGFFMNQQKIADIAFLSTIIDKLHKDIKYVNQVCLSMILKEIRYTSVVPIKKDIMKLIRSMRPYINNYRMFTINHVIHLMGGGRVYDEEIIQNSTKRLIENFDDVRMKDIERITYALCTCTPYTKYRNELETLLEMLLATYKTKKAGEIHKYPKPLVRITMFLLLKKIYSKELLAYIMDPTYVKKIIAGRLDNISNEYFFINGFLKTELPSYKGPFINDKLETYSIKKLCKRAELSQEQRIASSLSDLLFACKEKLKIDACTDYILPHFYNLHIIIGFDKQNRVIPVGPILAKMPKYSIKRVDTEELRDIKFKVLLVLYDSLEVIGENGIVGFCGTVYAIFRQLKAIGYHPIPLHKQSWDKFSYDVERCNYLSDLIYNDVDYSKKFLV